jgi:hypothetical protein
MAYGVGLCSVPDRVRNRSAARFLLSLATLPFSAILLVAD